MQDLVNESSVCDSLQKGINLGIAGGGVEEWTGHLLAAQGQLFERGVRSMFKLLQSRAVVISPAKSTQEPSAAQVLAGVCLVFICLAPWS